MKKALSVLIALAMLDWWAGASAQAPLVVLRPARVFDGDSVHEGWAVSVQRRPNRRGWACKHGLALTGAQVIDLPAATLTPGLIEGHSHVLLHPYNETKWEDQVLDEGLALRVARATNHLRATLLAGFTTIRDLGTEGRSTPTSSSSRRSIRASFPGRACSSTTRAIVATGSYGAEGFRPGMARAAGRRGSRRRRRLTRVVRDQIGHGADWIKVYADYRWGARGEAAPTFSLEEMTTDRRDRAQQRPCPSSRMRARRKACGGPCWQASRRSSTATAALPEVFRLMVERNVALCPTLAAGDATSQYAGGRRDSSRSPPASTRKRASFKAALDAGVTILSGSDVGVFTHGDNARELELMVLTAWLRSRRSRAPRQSRRGCCTWIRKSAE